MKKWHICPHIAPSCALNWHLVPDEQSEGEVTVVTGFLPTWWARNYGIIINEEWHINPEVRRESLIHMEEFLQERFSRLPNFFCGPGYKGSYPIEFAYGCELVPALFGCPLVYSADGYPFSNPLKLSQEQAIRLETPNLDNSPLLKSLWTIPPEQPNKRVTGQLGVEGVLNIALKLRGEEIFIDMLNDKPLACHIFEVITETLIQLVHKIRKWQDPQKNMPTYIVTSNCTVNMISGEMYQDLLLSYDLKLAHAFDIFGMHNCGWRVDPYIDSYAKIEDLAYLDMGGDTDIARVHKAFPQLSLTFFYPPDVFRRQNPDQIYTEIKNIGKAINKGYILLSDLDVGVGDEQVIAAYEAIRDIRGLA